MTDYKRETTNLFDLQEDEDGTLRMPFNPADYGEDNDVERECMVCGNEFPQGEMHELYSDDPDAYKDGRSFFASSIFYCRDCWFSNDISNADYWRA